MKSQEIAERRVARGAARLDDRGPKGWFRKVKITQLDINSLVDCVLSQVYQGKSGQYSWTGSYGYGLAQLGLNDSEDAEQYGFMSTARVKPELLDEAWKKVIRERRTRH